MQVYLTGWMCVIVEIKIGEDLESVWENDDEKDLMRSYWRGKNTNFFIRSYMRKRRGIRQNTADFCHS